MQLGITSFENILEVGLHTEERMPLFTKKNKRNCYCFCKKQAKACTMLFWRRLGYIAQLSYCDFFKIIIYYYYYFQVISSNTLRKLTRFYKFKTDFRVVYIVLFCMMGSTVLIPSKKRPYGFTVKYYRNISSLFQVH